MTSFKEYLLLEMPQLLDSYHKSSNQLSGEKFSPTGKTLISKLPSGHSVYTHFKTNEHVAGGSRHYEAVKDGVVHMAVQGAFEKKERSHSDPFEVVSVKGHPTSTLRAHDFYHHLIKNHGLTLHSATTQSPGGSHIWKELSKKDDIKVSRKEWSPATPHPEIEMHDHKNWIKNYDNEDSYFEASKKK